MSESDAVLPEAIAHKSTVAPPDRLLKIKDTLGPLNKEVIEAETLTEAHQKLGEKHRQKISSALETWLGEMPKKKALELINLTRKITVYMQNRAEELKNSDPEISSAITEYLACVSAWSEGAGLAESNQAGRLGATSAELALLMQNDSVGCQSIMIRGDNGQILMGHSEEDIDTDRVTRNNWTTFKFKSAGKEAELTAFTSYTDLLPGPAFGLTPNGIMASDAIFPEVENKIGFLGNSVTWILWRMGAESSAPVIVTKLLPSPSGYALNLAYTENGRAVGQTLEFAADRLSVTELGQNPGDHSFHTNAIKETDPDLKQLEELTKTDSRFYEKRAHTLTAILDAIKNRPDHSFKNPLESLKKDFWLSGFRTGPVGFPQNK
jgi:hypothetical protein